MTIYLLRFTEPLGNERHSARFYVGYTRRKLADRLAEHAQGAGAAITRAAAERVWGIEPWRVVWAVKGDRGDEWLIKRYKRAERFAGMTPRQVRTWLAQARARRGWLP